MITLDWSVMKYLGKKLCSLSFHYLVKMFKIKYCSCSIFYEGVRKVFNVNIELRVYLIQMFNKFSESSSSVQSSRPDLISQSAFDDNSQHPNTVFISIYAKDEWPAGNWLEECQSSIEPTVSKHKTLNREPSNGRVSCEVLTMTRRISGKLGGAEAGCFGCCVQCPWIQWISCVCLKN